VRGAVAADKRPSTRPTDRPTATKRSAAAAAADIFNELCLLDRCAAAPD